MKILMGVNLAAVCIFAYLAFIRVSFAALDVFGNYTQLDRAGVINEEAPAQFHPSYGFTRSSRYTVSRFIAGPALSAAAENALLGFVLAVLNSFISVGFFLESRLDRKGKPGEHGATNPT